MLPTLNEHSGERFSLIDFILIATSFGIITGLVEGAGLMLFQRLNWASWGPMIHVSWPILWISPIVDLILFLLVAVVAWLIGRLLRRIPSLKVLVFVLTVLSIYDWLTLTKRLYHWSSLLLAAGAAFAIIRAMDRPGSRIIPFLRRTALWAMVVWLLAFTLVQAGGKFREKRELAALPESISGTPNVLIIVVDTLRADHLSAYGYSRPTSPTIDSMAKEGVLFENAISTCSWSFPSHVSLVTGRYQFEHGMGAIPAMPVFGPAVPGFHGYDTLGEALERRGYRTAGFSANRTYFSKDLGFGIGMTHFEDYFHSPADDFVRTLYGREFARVYLSRTDHSKPKRFLRWIGFDSILDSDEEGSGSTRGAQGVRKRATVVNQEVLRWIDRGPREHTFFAFLNYFDVHGPYGGPKSFTRPWPQDEPVDLYDDSVRYVDDSIAQLMDGLKQRGLDRNTLVVITSDHGESLGQHDLETHGSALYRELIKVPLIFWYPEHVPAGKRVDGDVSNAAIPATVLDLIGSDVSVFRPPSLKAFWADPDPGAPLSPAISELAENHFLSKKEQAAARSVPTAISGSMQSLVLGSWHLIVHEKLGVQLYNWKDDPGELNDLSHTDKGQAVAKEMRERLSQERSATRMSP